MPRDTILFDINETVLDLASLRPRFESVFGDAGVTSTWFAMLLHTSTVCALTGVKTGFAALAATMLDAIAARRGVPPSPRRSANIHSRAVLPAWLRTATSCRPCSDLRAGGYRTVAFSNSSLDLVTNQIANAGLCDHYDDDHLGRSDRQLQAGRRRLPICRRAPRAAGQVNCA